MSKTISNHLKFKNEEEIISHYADCISLDIVYELKKVMEQKNMNKVELAKLLGTSKSYITQLFSGDKLINLKLLGKIKRKLNIQVKFSITINP